MRVRIVCYEDPNQWILGKFARRLCECLVDIGISADLAQTPDTAADVNHHIIYLDRRGRAGRVDTAMVTHVDEIGKVRLLRGMMGDLDAAICMSREAVGALIAQGLPPTRLTSIPPAHDGQIRPRPLEFGITSKVHPDGRKREWMLLEAAKEMTPADGRFRIMGEGWGAQIAELRARGFEVDHAPEFERELYGRWMPELDYYLYFGMDEGSMGFLDALAAGVRTVVTPQGYHLDVACAIDHPFRTVNELRSEIASIIESRRGRISSIAGWTWPEYARRHLELWHHLLGQPEGARAVIPAHAPSTHLGLGDRLGLQWRLLGGSLRTRVRHGRFWRR
jgi:hypothetical protein